MRCKNAQKLISEYIDGNLNAENKKLLQNHVAQCPDCQKLLRDFQLLREKASSMNYLKPSPQVWFRIKQGVKEKGKQKREFPKGRLSLIFSPSTLRYALGTAVLLMMLAGAAFIGFHYWRGIEDLSPASGQEYTLAKLKEAERHYKLAIQALQEAVSSSKKNFDPELAQVFQRNLDIINNSIQNCRQAVLDNPQNMEARQYLLAMYKEKLDFLNEMVMIQENPSTQNKI